MSERRWWALALAAPLVGIYAYRCAVGVPASIALARGQLAIARGAYRLALPELQQAGVGFNRFEATWRVGDSAIDHWENESRFGGPAGADPALLQTAAAAYSEGICLAPASRRPWAGLALVYHKLEWIARIERASREATSEDGWSAVGRSGRIAIGLARRAVERAPNWYVSRDWLARAFWTFGLESEMLESVKDSARAMPLYGPHNYLQGSLEPSILDDFIDTSRAYVGRVPLVDPATQLIDLGKLEMRRGNAQQATADFDAAMAHGLDPLREAEANYYVGLALAGDGRMAEARERLTLAREHPVFEIPALMNLALFEERAGDYEAALESLRVLRRSDSDNVDYCLRYAEAASRLERWDAALEALRWARLVVPRDTRSLVMLVEVHLAAGDASNAHLAIKELERVDAQHPELTRLRGLLTTDS